MSIKNYVVVHGGSGVTGARSVISQLASLEPDMVPDNAIIYAYDPDVNDDMAELKSDIKKYQTLHKYSNGAFASTELHLSDEKITALLPDKQVSQLINKEGDNIIFMDLCYSKEDQGQNSRIGIYGKTHIGAALNIFRTEQFEQSELMKNIAKDLGDNKHVRVILCGSQTGGTGESFTLDTAEKIRKIVRKNNLGGVLEIGLVLLGPYSAHPNASEEDRKKYGEKADVDSKESFSRTVAAIRHMANIPDLLQNGRNEDRYLVNRIYILGQNQLDMRSGQFQPERQKRHSIHLMDFLAGQCMLDFLKAPEDTFKNVDKKEQRDTGLRTIVLNGNWQHELMSMGWENISPELKNPMIKKMRMDYLLLKALIPFFSMDLNSLKKRILIRALFTSRVLHKLQLDANMLAAIQHKLNECAEFSKTSIRILMDMQDCTRMGTSNSEFFRLFDQQVLIKLYNTCWEQQSWDEIVKNALCYPDELTADTYPDLQTGLTADGLMDRMAADKNLKEICHNNLGKDDLEQSVDNIVKALLNSLYQAASEGV